MQTTANGVARWRIYSWWAAWVGVAFFAVYPTLNWLSDRRADRWHLYFDAELRLPFVPGFIWVYLSMYVLFVAPVFLVPARHLPALGKQLIVGALICGLVFAAFPGELGFARSLPTDALLAQVYATIFSLDRPHNLVPSLHVLFSAAIVFACAPFAALMLRVVLFVWLGLIGASTVLVHQHHLLDVAAALMLVWALRRYFTIDNALILGDKPDA